MIVRKDYQIVPIPFTFHLIQHYSVIIKRASNKISIYLCRHLFIYLIYGTILYFYISVTPCMDLKSNQSNWQQKKDMYLGFCTLRRVVNSGQGKNAKVIKFILLRIVFYFMKAHNEKKAYIYQVGQLRGFYYLQL